MTAKADRIAAASVRAIESLGALGVLITTNDSYSAGGVTGTSSSETVTLVGPIDDRDRYASGGADSRTTATFYLAALGLIIPPKLGGHITFTVGGVGTEYVIVGMSQYSLQGTLVAWQLDVGEIGPS